jgi:hypothetical protein
MEINKRNNNQTSTEIMRTTHDWLPKNHEALYDFIMQAMSYLSNPVNRDRMGFANTTPQGIWLTETCTPKFTAFTTAFSNWKNPAERTPVKTTTLEKAEKACREMFRKLYTGCLKNSPVVTDEDLQSMGLPARHSGGGKPVPPPTTFVAATVTPIGQGIIEIHFRDKGSDSKAKPAGVHGAEIAWAILDTPPIEYEELTHSSFDTQTPLRMTFENHLRGKILYFALRWENTTGEKGPWGEIMSAIIP